MHRQLSVITIALVGLAAPIANAAGTLTYGPIIARGVTGDKMMVHWGSSATLTPTVQYRPAGTSTFQTVTGAGSCSGSNCDWEAIIPGLNLGASYEYQVPTDATTHAFHTCPAAGMPMDLVFYGDSRDGETEHAKIVAQLMKDAPDIVFESGDIQADGSYAGYITNFFKTAGGMVATTPFMAAPGNHDANQLGGLDMVQLKGNYGKLFPTSGRTLNDSNWLPYYSFTCGNAMFIALDGNNPGDSAQKTFLNAQITAAKADASIDHVFVWLHQAPYSVGQHGDDSGTQSNFTSIFDAADSKVTAVFAGHDHIYARMDDGSHPVYIVSGGAGAPYYQIQSTSKATTKKAVGGASEYNFVKLHVAGNMVTGTAYDDSGNMIDSFTTMGAGTGGSGGGGGGGAGGSGGGGGSGGTGGSGGGGGDGGTGGTGGGGSGGTGGNGNNNGSGMGGCSVAGASSFGALIPFALAFLGLGLRRRRRA